MKQILHNPTNSGIIFPAEALLPPKSFDWAAELSIPVCIFKNSPLSSLEAIIKFLREEIGLPNRAIGYLICRDERTVWGAYEDAKRKMATALEWSTGPYDIPIHILRNRSLGVLEIISYFLKETFALRYCDIARLISRNDRTVWTSYHRAWRKMHGTEN